MRISDWSSDVCSSDLQSFSATASRMSSYSRPQRPVERYFHPPSASRHTIFPDSMRVAVRCAVRTTDPEEIPANTPVRSEEHTSELQSLMRISYAVFCLKTKTNETMMTTTNIR